MFDPEMLMDIGQIQILIHTNTYLTQPAHYCQHCAAFATGALHPLLTAHPHLWCVLTIGTTISGACSKMQSLCGDSEVWKPWMWQLQMEELTRHQSCCNSK